MEVFTIVGVMIGLIGAFFLPMLMEEAGREMRNELQTRHQHRPRRSKTVKRSRPRPAANAEVNVHRIQGDICWRTGQRRRDCECGSCRK